MFNNLYMKYTGEKVEFNFTQLKSSQALKFGTEMINIRVFDYIYIFFFRVLSVNKLNNWYPYSWGAPRHLYFLFPFAFERIPLT